MINALRYEPQGQRQRFEAREQQEQDRHIHLHIHLNLTFRARQTRSIPTPNATRITRIFVALVGATVIPLWLLGASAMESITPSVTMSGAIFLVGLAIAGGVDAFRFSFLTRARRRGLASSCWPCSSSCLFSFPAWCWCFLCGY